MLLLLLLLPALKHALQQALQHGPISRARIA
jgi:hypothetical protein